MYVSSRSVAAFGKLPAHGDFVRHNVSPTARVIDDWIQRGLFFARRETTFDRAYAEAPTYAFLFDANDGNNALVGILQPSNDRVGRKYPFMIAFETESVRESQAPLRYDGFLRRAAETAREAIRVGADFQTVARQAQEIANADSFSTTAFEPYAARTPLRALWERFWGYPNDSRKYLLFRNLIDIMNPVRGQVPDRFPLVLRFPLSPDADTRAFDASFWVEVCLRLFDDASVRPSYFWAISETPSITPPHLFIALRPPPPDTLVHLFSSDAETDNVCKLEQMGDYTAAEAALGIPERFGRMLESEHVTLQEFLAQN